MKPSMTIRAGFLAEELRPDFQFPAGTRRIPFLQQDDYGRRQPGFRRELMSRLADGDAKIARLLSETSSEFSAGQCLVTAGEPHNYVWRLRRGWCIRWRTDASGNRRIIAIYMASDLLVLNSMFLPVQCDTYEFLTRASVQGIDQARLHQEMERDCNVALRIFWQEVEEEFSLANRLFTSLKSSSEERIIKMLLDLENRLAPLGLVKDDCFQMPMRQLDIGDYLGVSMVHVNRILRKLRTQGIAVIERGEARLLDRARMRRLVPPDCRSEDTTHGRPLAS
jgi:CRP/FNR family transcriptional regulator, anaerobic regulatory protein